MREEVVKRSTQWVWSYKLRKWGIRLKEISGVSAGAAMALGILSESEDETIEYLAELTKRTSSNFQLTSLFQGKSPFPHENIYRRLIRHGLNLEKFESLKSKFTSELFKLYLKNLVLIIFGILLN